MIAGQCQQLFGIGSITREAGDPIGDLGRGLAVDHAGAFDLEHLCNAGPVEVTVQRRGAGELAGFDAAVALVPARSRLLFFLF